jgi:DNA-binding response OmpR family regulator
MSATPHPILIVEDDSDLSELIKIQLTDNDYEIEQVLNGRIALEKALSNQYSLIILDIMLPEVDGFEICRSIRKENTQVPILMLTAKAEEVDKIMGLEYGADDYLTKPFSVKELIARVKAILRRAATSEEKDSSKSDKLDFGNLIIYPNKRAVQVEDDLIELTSKEFELLLLFANNPGRAYSRQELLDVVWGYQYSGYSHTVNSHINRLRSKIEKNPSEPKYITTVWGMGYKFAELEELGLK